MPVAIRKPKPHPPTIIIFLKIPGASLNTSRKTALSITSQLSSTSKESLYEDHCTFNLLRCSIKQPHRLKICRESIGIEWLLNRLEFHNLLLKNPGGMSINSQDSKEESYAK